MAQLDDNLRQNAEESGTEPPAFSDYDDRLVVTVFEITGIAVLPQRRSQEIPQASFTLEGYAEFAEPTAEELAAARTSLPDDLAPEIRMEVEGAIADFETIDERPSALYLRFSRDAPSTSDAVAAVDGVPEVVNPTPDQVLTLLVGLNVKSSDRVPIALAATVSVLFGLLASYLLFASVRSRRLELAVMRSLGMSTSGIRRSVAAQATATVLIALIIAIPVGVLVGRWAWLRYAREIRVLPVAVIPWPTLAIGAVAALAAANLAAITLGWPATTRSPEPDLRSE